MSATRAERRAMNEVDRFWSYVNKTPTCWLWHGGIDHGGYGRYNRKESDGKYHSKLAHRYCYELVIGPIPQGLQLDHVKSRCTNRNCVNPAHLEIVTLQENNTRGDSPSALNIRKTHCKRGHPLIGDNLHINPSGDRICRECSRLIQRAYYQGKRAKDLDLEPELNQRLQPPWAIRGKTIDSSGNEILF